MVAHFQCTSHKALPYVWFWVEITYNSTQKDFCFHHYKQKRFCKTVPRYIILEGCCAHFDVKLKFIRDSKTCTVMFILFSLYNPLHSFFYSITCVLFWFRMKPISPWGKAPFCFLCGIVVFRWCSVLSAAIRMKWTWSEMSSY